jgi:hypothetical protein
MAKKIILAYSAQPLTDNTGFNFSIEVSGFDIYFSNGETECNIEYIPFGDTPATINELAIGVDLGETLQITLSYLREVFINSLVTYNIVNDTIEVFINADATVTVNGDTNDNITLTTTDVEPSGVNLIYYLYFDNYVLNIYKENYNGSSTEIYGSFALKKSSVETILTPIRGTGLELSLEANQSITFDEFILNDEFTYKTELLKSGQIIFEGYIKPDGVQQSYITDLWFINIESTDGLGALKDLSFVQTNGLQFTGKMSVYNVIKACLDRTRLTMDINTSMTVAYLGYAGSNILKDIYVNADRFIKDSADIVIMDCNEVLTSMLNLFSAVITQQDGQWWIYRPNDLIFNGYTEFINQTTNATFTKNLNAVLGSQIDNFYPHHCNGDQQIEVKGAISAYRLNYKYGFLGGFISNPNLNHDDLDFDDWTVEDATVLVNEPLDTSGAIMTTESQANGIFPLTEVLTSTPIIALENQELTLRVKLISFYYKHNFYFKVKTSDGYFLNNSNNWVVGETSNPCVIVPCGSTDVSTESAVTFDLIMPPVTNDCTIELIICRPIYPFATVTAVTRIAEVTYAQILDNVYQRNGIVGEFHTVTRFTPPSSITKENQTVFNGDGSQVLIGSIYKEDLLTETTQWTRKDKFESLPLLGISAMDDLRIQANAIKVFSGSIFGEIPYMSVITINNIVGYFMPIEYDYNYKTNISQVKLLQFYNDDIADIQYEVSPDYGNNTIKPTIKG